MANSRRKTEKMSDISFKFMDFSFKIMDFFFPYIKKRIEKFDIREGMTILDYGCGPGRYTIKFAKIVGDKGKVYAADIHKLAIAEVNKKIKKLELSNVETILVKGYNCPLPDKTADIICALDMFFMIEEPKEFLGELHRLIKDEGTLIIDDGHQRRSTTKSKIDASGFWSIHEETKDHLKCKPIKIN